MMSVSSALLNMSTLQYSFRICLMTELKCIVTLDSLAEFDIFVTDPALLDRRELEADELLWSLKERKFVKLARMIIMIKKLFLQLSKQALKLGISDCIRKSGFGSYSIVCLCKGFKKSEKSLFFCNFVCVFFSNQ